jgi:hypothetical protein
MLGHFVQTVIKTILTVKVNYEKSPVAELNRDCCGVWLVGSGLRESTELYG